MGIEKVSFVDYSLDRVTPYAVMAVVAKKPFGPDNWRDCRAECFCPSERKKKGNEEKEKTVSATVNFNYCFTSKPFTWVHCTI
jgi:hypothetical protein